jgi:hypothetical protein
MSLPLTGLQMPTRLGLENYVSYSFPHGIARRQYLGVLGQNVRQDSRDLGVCNPGPYTFAFCPLPFRLCPLPFEF